MQSAVFGVRVSNALNNPLPWMGMFAAAVVVISAAVLAVQHALNAQLDFSDVTYRYGPEVRIPPPDPQWLAALRERETTEVISLRPFGNGEAVRRSVVQFVAHHQGSVVRYGYVDPSLETITVLERILHEIGFSNKYDEPLMVQLPPDVAESFLSEAPVDDGREGMRGWVGDLPQTNERPVLYSRSLPDEWPVVVVRIEPSYPTVAMLLAVVLIGVLALIALVAALLERRWRRNTR